MSYKDERKLPIFIHSELDDAELSVYAFRIYCRIARRAGQNGQCHESTPNMADGCGMSRKRASKAVKELQSRGMIRVNRRPGQTNEIVLTEQSKWSTPVENARPTPVENARGVRSKTPDPPRSKTPDKGTPFEGTPLKDDEEDARARLDFLPEEHAYLAEEIADNLAAFEAGTVDAQMLARRLLKRGRQGFPKTLVASHVRRYEPERWVAAWTIASVSASNNPSKYANTILTSGFTRRHERPDQDRRDDGSDPEATFQRHFAAASAAFDGWPGAEDMDGEGDAR